MSYAIGQIIYGLNLNDNKFKGISDVLSFLAESETISTSYSGSGDGPQWIGPELAEIDECTEVKIDEAFLSSLRVTAEVQKQFEEARAQVLQTLQDDQEEIVEDSSQAQYDLAVEQIKTATPYIWLVWGTS